MKIVCLFGSPRSNGNSAAIATRFCETAKNLGAEVQLFWLNKLKYQGCQGCMVCKTKLDKCVLKDDLTDVLETVCESDILVMASSTYFGEVTSQLKAFIDRTFSYLVPDYVTNSNRSRLSSGKKLVFIQTQASPYESRFADVFPRYEYFFKWHGFEDNHLFRACGVRDTGDVKSHEKVMKQAEETAEKIVG